VIGTAMLVTSISAGLAYRAEVDEVGSIGPSIIAVDELWSRRLINPWLVEEHKGTPLSVLFDRWRAEDPEDHRKTLATLREGLSRNRLSKRPRFAP